MSGCRSREDNEKYAGVLGAVDVFTAATAFATLESVRLDLGYRMDVHP